MRAHVLLLLLSFPLYSNAQTSSEDPKQTSFLGKGNWLIGMNGWAGYGSKVGVVGHLTPRIQYFLADGWSVGLEGRYRSDGKDSDYWGGGIFSRYYAFRLPKVGLFAQASLGYGTTRYQRLEGSIPTPLKGSDKQAALGLGVHYRLAKRWALEGMIERKWIEEPYSQYQVNSVSPWQASIGVNFKLK